MFKDTVTINVRDLTDPQLEKLASVVEDRSAFDPVRSAVALERTVRRAARDLDRSRQMTERPARNVEVAPETVTALCFRSEPCQDSGLCRPGEHDVRCFRAFRPQS